MTVTTHWIAVGLGGALGAMARYGVVLATAALGQPGWVGIVAVNGVGCLLLGLCFGAIQSTTPLPALLLGVPTQHWQLLVMTGLLGALTTFSTFTGDIWAFTSTQQWFMALVYVLGSIASGFTLFWAGLQLSRQLFS